MSQIIFNEPKYLPKIPLSIFFQLNKTNNFLSNLKNNLNLHNIYFQKKKLNIIQLQIIKSNCYYHCAKTNMYPYAPRETTNLINWIEF